MICNMVGLFVTDAWLPSPPLKPTRSRAPRRGSGAGAGRGRGSLAASGARHKAGAGAVEMRARHKAGAVKMRVVRPSASGPPKPLKPCAHPQQGARGPPTPRPPRSDTAPKSRVDPAKIAAGAPQARQPSTASRHAPRAQAKRAPTKGAR